MKHTIFKKLMLSLSLFVSFQSFSHDFEIDGIYYNILSETEKTAEVVGTDLDLVNVIIPSNITYKNLTYNVISIGTHAFWDDYTEYVNIPNSVIIIKNDAFNQCYWLTSIEIGDGLQEIEGRQFCDCPNLKSIQIDSNNKHFCFEGGTLFNYDKTCLFYHIVISNEDYIIPNSVFTIRDYAFIGSEINTLTLGGNVREIENHAFDLSFIDYFATDSENRQFRAKDGVLFSFDRTKLIAYPNNSSRTTYEIPSTVTTIGNNAFSYCNLKSLNIPNSVTTIGDNAFYNCNFTDLIIPNSVITIGDSAFSYCNFTDLIIPNSVTTIGFNAFARCSKLESIQIGSGLKNYTGNFLIGCNKLQDISVDRNNNALIVLNGILYSFDKTKLICCPATKNISEYTIPNTVQTIENGAFLDCSNLSYVTIPNSVTSIGDKSFAGCNLKSLAIPNSVVNIGEYAFSNCKLETLTLGSKIKKIKSGAFINNSSIKEIISKSPTPPLLENKNVFEQSVYDNAELIVPTDCKDIYSTANVWSDFWTITEKKFSTVENTFIDSSATPVEYYNLQGVRVDNPEKGVYIKRQGGKTTKVHF